jgi:autotransporter-associated beta strand protein
LELSQTTIGTPTNISVGAESLTLNGEGISNGGALRNHSGNNIYGGAITIGVSGARINSNADTSLSLTGGVVTALTQNVTFGGAGNTTVETTGISGGGSLIKDGTGTFTITSAVTYTGATDINEGTMLIHGSTSSSSTVTVASGATLGGDGTVGGSTTFNNGSKFGWNLSVTDPSSTGSATVADTFAVTGNLVDGGDAGGSVFKILLSGTQTFADNFWNASHTWNNVLTSGNSLDLGGLFSDFSYANASGPIDGPAGGAYFTLSGNTLSFTAIPEPTTTLCGLLLTAGLLRRRRKFEG